MGHLSCHVSISNVKRILCQAKTAGQSHPRLSSIILCPRSSQDTHPANYVVALHVVTEALHSTFTRYQQMIQQKTTNNPDRGIFDWFCCSLSIALCLICNKGETKDCANAKSMRRCLRPCQVNPSSPSTVSCPV